MSTYLLENFKYMKTLSYSDIEKADFEFTTARVPFNIRERYTRFSANKPLSPEEFEKEYDSPYKTKKYHYNFRHPEEMSERNLRQTFLNMYAHDDLVKSEKTVREENLNFDVMSSKEREEILYKMKRNLEEMSELPIENESFFSVIQEKDKMYQSYKVWRMNMTIPLQDHLEEHAKRKMEKVERDKHAAENADQAFFRQPGTEDELYDIEAHKRRTERQQAILRQKIAEQEGVDYEEVKPDFSGNDDPYRDTVDNMPVKRREKWRIW